MGDLCPFSKVNKRLFSHKQTNKNFFPALSKDVLILLNTSERVLQDYFGPALMKNMTCSYLNKALD